MELNDEYDVNKYTEDELLQVLNLNNPSDRELEAKILSMIRKYSTIGNESGNKLSQFFIDIYNRFFDNAENDTNEGFQSEINLQGANTNTTNKPNNNTGEDGVKLTKQLNIQKTV